MKKAILNLFAIFCVIVSAQAQSGHTSYLNDQAGYREHPLDIQHVKVEVHFVPEEKKVLGHVWHTIQVKRQQCDSVFFDAPGIIIQSANYNQHSITFHTVKEGVWVLFDKPLSVKQTGIIEFQYEAHPKKGIYFIGWNQKVPENKNPWTVRRQIWTQGQGIDNRYWIPMYDDMNDKFTTETIVHFPEAYKVLSNGKCIENKKESNGNMLWHYRMSHPHAGYLLMLAIGEYEVFSTKTKRGIPVNYWYYPECKDRMPSTFRYTPEMIDFMEHETGIPYPWESYSQVMVQEFIYGAMENTTATIFGDFFNTDDRAALDRSYEEVNMHELTHQWFGDFITARDGRDTWLQESFATYWPKQFARFRKGNDEWEWICRNHQNSAVEAGKKDAYPVHHSMGGTARNYPKGAAVISMLEYVLGNDQWKRVLNHYVQNHAYANVETNDLMQACKDEAGLNLDWFFDEWILRGGEPVFQVSYEIQNSGIASTLQLQVQQTQTRSETVGLFKMPVDIEIGYSDGSKTSKQIWVSQANEYFKIALNGSSSVDYVVFDAGSRIIKTLHFEKDFESLHQQALQASHYIDRYDAVVSMRSLPIAQKRSALLEVLSHEKHYGILNEIISQLGSDNESRSDLIKLNSYAQASSTRLALIQYLPESKIENKAMLEAALMDSSYDVVKLALEKLCFQYPSEVPMYLEKTKAIQGMHQMVRLKWLEISVFYGIQKEAATREIAEYVSAQYEFRTRLQAIQILKSLNYLDEAICKEMLLAILSPNSRLAGPMQDAINYFHTQLAFHRLFLNAFQSPEILKHKDEIKKQIAWLK